ncbi:MAG: ATP-binding protein [bacterium]|nr:ATP-binding protein [bacterium]
MKIFSICIVILTVAGFVFLRIRNLYTLDVSTYLLELNINTLERIIKTIESEIKSIESNVVYIAKIQNNITLDYFERAVMLKNFIDINPKIVSISIVDKNGKELLKAFNPEYSLESTFKDISNTSIFKALAIKDTAFEIYFDTETMLSYIYRFDEKNKLSIFINVSLKDIQREIEKIKIGRTGVFGLIKDSIYIFHTDKSKLGSKIEDRFNKTYTGSGSYEEFDEVVTFRSVEALNAYAIITQKKADVYRALYSGQKQAFFIFAFGGVLALVLSLFLSNLITAPLRKLKNLVLRIDLEKGVFPEKIDIRSKDEVGELSDTVNKMVDKLKRYAELQVDKLIVEERKLQAIIFSIEDGLMLVDGEGVIQLINKKAKELLNLDVGMKIDEVIVDARIKEAFEKIKTSKTELNMSDENMSRYFEVFRNVVVHPKGDEIGELIVLRDITLEKEIERMKNDFIHSITHDLKNPLSSIIGYLKLIMDEKFSGSKLTQRQVEYINVIEKNAKRLLTMINDILDIAKYEEGQLEVLPQEFSLEELLDEVLNIEQPLAASKNIEIIKEINFKNHVVLDMGFLERILINLIGNAIKFTPHNGKIKIGVIEDGDYLRFYVSDTGPGIPKEYQTRIFEKFKQIPGQKRGGTGLGLTITKAFVELQGGKIWVESEVGKGATFYFTLPKIYKSIKQPEGV